MASSSSIVSSNPWYSFLDKKANRIGKPAVTVLSVVFATAWMVSTIQSSLLIILLSATYVAWCPSFASAEESVMTTLTNIRRSDYGGRRLDPSKVVTQGIDKLLNVKSVEGAVLSGAAKDAHEAALAAAKAMVKANPKVTSKSKKLALYSGGTILLLLSIYGIYAHHMQKKEKEKITAIKE
ncbi:hypothetical protein CCR75_008372 [Bremia lactucae]|uniref:Uncharacterized protein n=1 Tax=Bremia lactucae TaxID=4779 RepID=A0A976FGK1_BRELC|nr:hypothetical protein CCR75_008372 [Bremia lactucae]